MATYIDGNLNFKHTKGDHLDVTLTVKSNGSAIDWASEGYASGVMQVRDRASSSGALIATVSVDISVNGQMTLSTSTPISANPKTYYYDIQMTMTSGKIKTLWDTQYREFEITPDITTV